MTQSFCAPFCFMVLSVFTCPSLWLIVWISVGLEWCTKYLIFLNLPVQKLLCSIMGHLPLSYQLDLCRLRFYHYMYYNFLSSDEIVWHVANAVKRRLIDQGRCGVLGSTLAFGSIGHEFEAEHRLFSYHGASAFSKLRSLAKCSLDDSVLRLL